MTYRDQILALEADPYLECEVFSYLKGYREALDAAAEVAAKADAEIAFLRKATSAIASSFSRKIGAPWLDDEGAE